MARYLGRKRRMPVWKLDPDEMKLLTVSAQKIAEAKHETARDRYYLDGRHPNQRDLEGLMGEYAVGVHYDIEIDLSAIKGRGDDGYDLEYELGTIGVKSSRYFDSRLLVKKNEPICRSYVLCEVDVEAATVKLVGWITGNAVKKREPVRVHENGPLNYVVSRAELRDLPDPAGYRELVRSYV